MNDNGKVRDIKKLLRKKKVKRVITDKDLLSTGLTNLNLACTGRAQGGLVKGLYSFFVGDSSAGKTVVALTCLAEATINPNFGNYRLIFDNAENGALMDLCAFFGKALERKLEPPAGTKEEPTYSSTIEEFYYNITNACDRADEGEPFIYVLDSMDALDAKDDIDKFEEKKEAYEEGKKDPKGSYGTAKAKANSSGMRLVSNRLRKSKSILIVLAQTRDRIGFTAMFNPKTRSGGNALRFYNRNEIWFSVKEPIKVRALGKDRKVGITAKIKVVKNHVNGWEGEVEVDIYRGKVDDIGSCINYLVNEGHWSASKNIISVPEWELKLKKEALVRHIEENDLEEELHGITAAVWNEIEAACQIKRKPRYE